MDAKELVICFFVEGYTNRNYDFIMEHVSDTYFDHSPAAARSNADAVGILKIVAGQYIRLDATVVDIFSAGEMVAARIRFDGLHRETGKQISFEALENFRVVANQIVESWGYWPDKEIEQKLMP